MKPLLKRPSHAVVVAYLALIVALGGTSYAATQLPKNSVGTKQLKNDAVTGSKIKNGSVSKGDLAKGIVRPLAGIGANGAGMVQGFATFGAGEVVVTKSNAFLGTYCVSAPDLPFEPRFVVGFSIDYDANVNAFIGNAGNCPGADFEVLTTNVQAETGVSAPQDRQFSLLIG